MLLVLYPWGGVWMVVFVVIGYLLGDSAPWFIASLVTMPCLAFLVGGAEVVILLVALMMVLTFLKRLEANRRPLPPPGPERRWVIVRRLFLDRDIMDHQEWIDQQPDADGAASPPAQDEVVQDQNH